LTLAEVGNDARRAKAKKRWDAMSPEDRAAKLAKLVPFAAKTRRDYPPCWLLTTRWEDVPVPMRMGGRTGARRPGMGTDARSEDDG